MHVRTVEDDIENFPSELEKQMLSTAENMLIDIVETRNDICRF